MLKKDIINVNRNKENSNEKINEISKNFILYLEIYYPKKKYRKQKLGPVKQILDNIRINYNSYSKSVACGMAFTEHDKMNLNRNNESLIYLEKAVAKLYHYIQEHKTNIKKIIKRVEEEVYYLKKKNIKLKNNITTEM